MHGLHLRRLRLKNDADAPPLWGRLYEIGTNRVIMANRDGVKLYDWNKLTDRRSGYGWYTTVPPKPSRRSTNGRDSTRSSHDDPSISMTPSTSISF